MNLVTNKQNCSGCMACAYLCPKDAISPQKDAHGFYYPVINDKICVNCGICQKMCPFNNEEKTVDNNKTCYAVKNKNDDIRMKSSSGGIYSVLSNHFLSIGSVIYGAAFVSPNKVAHIRCTNNREIEKTKKSKYVQSNMFGVYKSIEQDLKQGRKVLFSGTPCQVASVKSVFRKYNEQMFFIDLICHGVPSPGLFEEHIKYCEKKSKKVVKEYCFRCKDQVVGNFGQKILYEDGTYDNESLYMKYYFNLFNENKILRSSCYRCPYACDERQGDITIGDFWGVEKYFPEFYDSKGVSAVILNTSKSREIFNYISDDIYYKEASFDDIANKNPNLSKPSPKPAKNFWTKYEKYGYDKIVDINTNSLVRKFKMTISKIL